MWVPTSTFWQAGLAFLRERRSQRLTLLAISARQHYICSFAACTYIPQFKWAWAFNAWSVEVFAPRKIVDVAIVTGHEKSSGNGSRLCQPRAILVDETRSLGPVCVISKAIE